MQTWVMLTSFTSVSFTLFPFASIPKIHEHFRAKLCDLYESDCIFDKFEACWSGDDSYVMPKVSLTFVDMYSPLFGLTLAQLIDHVYTRFLLTMQAHNDWIIQQSLQDLRSRHQA